MINTFLKKYYPLLPALVSGLLLTLAFPTFDIEALAWVAFIPLLVSAAQKDWKDAFLSGYVFGMAYFFGTLYWIYHSINHFGGMPFIASIGVVLLLCSYLGLYPALFSAFFSRIYQKTKLPALFIAPVLWVCLEFLRSYALTGFPWSSVGYSQYRFLTLIQVADITGIYGISFLVVAVNGLAADLLLIKRRIREMPLFPLSTLVAGSAALLLLLALSLGYGYWRLNQSRPGSDVTVSLIQGNIEQDKKWVPEYQDQVLDIYRSLSEEALKGQPSLVIWPETAVPFFYGTDAGNTARLGEMQRQLGVPLLFGSVLVQKQSQKQVELSNSAVLLDRKGNKSYVYDKIHLVPFGEYVPLRRLLFFVDKLVVGIGDFVSGSDYEPAESEIGRFGTLICYEIIFPGQVRKFYTGGGDFIVTLTNDAWFGNTAGPYQHFSMAVFRAIENRKPLLRAANSGISGVIDSSGRIAGASRLFERRALTQTVRTDTAMTFYTRFGDLFSFFCIVLSIIMAGNIISRR